MSYVNRVIMKMPRLRVLDTHSDGKDRVKLCGS